MSLSKNTLIKGLMSTTDLKETTTEKTHCDLNVYAVMILSLLPITSQILKLENLYLIDIKGGITRSYRHLAFS